jgi:TPR repeat protein
MHVRFIYLLLLSCLLQGCHKKPSQMHTAEHSYYAGNYSKSVRYLDYDARRGNPEAQYALGYMLYYGKGVDENRAEARKWFVVAALHGNVDAQRALKMISKDD